MKFLFSTTNFFGEFVFSFIVSSDKKIFFFPFLGKIKRMKHYLKSSHLVFLNVLHFLNVLVLLLMLLNHLNYLTLSLCSLIAVKPSNSVKRFCKDSLLSRKVYGSSHKVYWHYFIFQCRHDKLFFMNPDVLFEF